MDYYDYTIGQHFLTAIINDDYTGLDDEEHALLNSWLEDNEMRASHWTTDGESSDLSRCEITGMLSNCITTRQYFRK